MSELGTRLREARVEKGYTLNTLQQMTKIQKKYLQAIEEGQYDEVPGKFYVRAFIKQYADVVGLSGEELLEEFQEELETNSDEVDETVAPSETVIPSRLSQRQNNNDKSGWESIFSYLPVVFLIAIIVLIMLTLVIAINRIGNVERTNNIAESSSTSIVSSVEPDSVALPAADESSIESAETEPELAENQVKVGEQVLTLISGDGEETTYEISGAFSDYTFEAQGLGFVWVGMYEDEMMVADESIAEGDTYEFAGVSEGTTSFRIRFGYPEGGLVLVNGEELPIDNPIFADTVVFVLGDNTENNTESAPAETIELEIPTDETEVNEEVSTDDFQGPAVLDPSTNTGNE